jgi:ABC-type transport system involved in cytochrome c biogenesis permease subunit
MPRAKIWGLFSVLISLALIALFTYAAFIANTVKGSSIDLTQLSTAAYSAITIPISIVSFAVILTGFWIGWTILTIKVVPPMPEIVEKKDHSKTKAFFLCLFTLALAGALGFGIYIRSFWALAVPAAIIAAVILGAVFWVGVAILTTRRTLPE